MLNGSFNSNVVVAFTGDEEEDSNGCYEVIRLLKKRKCVIKFAIVTDVTEEGWWQEFPFTVENDLGIDILTAHRIVEALKPYERKYTLVHDAEPDEAWDYDEKDIPCLTFCAPIRGDMHSDKGVWARKNDMPVYAKALSVLANCL